MVVSCIAKGCENKQRRYTNTMFHRIPPNVERRNLWLAALAIPPTTHVEKIKQYRVCEEHFTPEDYVEKMQFSNRRTCVLRLKVLRLKNTAVPSIFRQADRSASSIAVRGIKSLPPSPFMMTLVKLTQKKKETAKHQFSNMSNR